MGFLAPWFFAGLAALGLPVYIHLLRRHRTTPQPFSSLMFFERRTQSSIRHRRLRYLLLWALRMLLLFLLALAFANPFVTGVSPAERERTLLVVAVDASFSMREGDRLERARREAVRVLGGRSASGQAQVIAFDSQVRVLTQPTVDPGELRAAVETIRAGDARGSYGELGRALRSIAQSSRLPLEVHLISDMQKSSLPASFSDLRLPAQARLTPHPVVSRPAPNWAVENVAAPGSIADPKKARVLATVAGYQTPAARRNVSLVANNRVLATKSVDVPAGGRVAVEFLTLDVPYGFNRAEVRLESGDALREDDRFLFAVERSDPRRVLFVHEARDTRAALYFRAALAAAAESSFLLEEVVVEQTAGLQPARYAFVVLSDVLSLPAAFEDALRQYVRTGGSLWIAAGAASARRPRLPVVDEAVLESRYYARSAERFQTVGNLDPAHPSIRRAGRWEGVKFYQVTRLAPGQARVVARLTDGTPLLVEKQVTEGRVLVFASTFDNISNDFPLHPVWVPFVEQTARYLAGLESRASNITVDSFVELRSVREKGVAVEVIDPEGRRPLALKDAASLQTYQLMREGYYELRRANGRHGMVAANPDRRESDLTTMAEETLALWQKTGAESAAAASGGAEQRRVRGLWWYAMLAVLATAMAESLFANRYLHVEEEEAA